MMTKELVNLQPVEWQDMYQLITSLYKNSIPQKEACLQISQYLQSQYQFNATIASTAATTLWQHFNPEKVSQYFLDVDNPSPDDDVSLLLSLQDINYIKHIYQETQDDNLTRLAAALAAYYRKYYHPSNWIHYDNKVIFYLASLTKLTPKQQSQLTNILYSRYNFSMRVVGSKQPISCFTLEWCNHQTPTPGDFEHNRWYNIGPMKPESITTLVDKIKTNREDY